MNEIVDENQLLAKVTEEVSKATSDDQLTSLWRKYLGKEGEVTELTKKIKDVPVEQRKDFGQTINNLKSSIDALINTAKEDLKTSSNKGYLMEPQASLTTSKPKVGHLHPLTQTILDLNDIFNRIGFSVMDGPELET